MVSKQVLLNDINQSLAHTGLKIVDIDGNFETHSRGEILSEISKSLGEISKKRTHEEIVQMLSDMEEEVDKIIQDFAQNVRKPWAEKLMAFMEEHLRDYEYNYHINGAVQNIATKLGLDEYTDAYNFWIPSHLDC